MRTKIGYGLLALLILTVGVGVPAWSTTRKKTVVKTRVVHAAAKQASYKDPASLIKFLGKSVKQAQAAPCPKGFPAGSACVQLNGKNYYIFFAFPESAMPAA